MHGALINRSVNLTGITWPLLPLPYDAEVYDTDAIFDPGTPGRFTIPAGFGYAKLIASIETPSSATTGSQSVLINKNGALHICTWMSVRNGTVGYGDNAMQSVTPWLPVVAGDYFEVRANVTGLGSPTSIVAGLRTFFGIELSN